MISLFSHGPIGDDRHKEYSTEGRLRETWTSVIPVEQRANVCLYSRFVHGGWHVHAKRDEEHTVIPRGRLMFTAELWPRITHQTASFPLDPATIPAFLRPFWYWFPRVYCKLPLYNIWTLYIVQAHTMTEVEEIINVSLCVI